MGFPDFSVRWRDRGEGLSVGEVRDGGWFYHVFLDRDGLWRWWRITDGGTEFSGESWGCREAAMVGAEGDALRVGRGVMGLAG